MTSGRNNKQWIAPAINGTLSIRLTLGNFNMGGDGNSPKGNEGPAGGAASG